jgi:hypothetical protein
MELIKILCALKISEDILITTIEICWVDFKSIEKYIATTDIVLVDDIKTYNRRSGYNLIIAYMYE